MKYTLGAIVLVTLMSSCARFSYESRGRIPVALNYKKNHNKTVTTEETRFFLFWGASPSEHKIYLDEEFEGYRSVSYVRIEEYQDFLDSFISVISLGIIIPRTYKITGRVM